MNITARLRDLISFREDVSCMTGCPVRTDSGMYVHQLAKGQVEDAYLTVRAPNPFASSCGHVCAAPCEDACRRGHVDRPVSIRSLKKYITGKFGVESGNSDTFKKLIEGTKPNSSINTGHVADVVSTASRTGKKIAVIGSGPAGLAAAHDLTLLGYKVTVFEQYSRAGGMVRYGIPVYRLSDDLLDKEIQSIVDMGVEIKLNTRIEAGGIAKLKQDGYEAIFIGTGVVKGRLLKMEGSDLEGVYTALDFLVDSANGKTTETGNRSVVIGGGLVAMDAARDVRRQVLAKNPDARYEIHLASLEDWNSMPAAMSESGRQEIEETLDEDIVFHPSWGPHRILGENGKVTGIELIKVVRVFDDDMRFNPQFDESDLRVIHCDSVIFAVGQMADLSFITETDGITISPRGTIQIDENLMSTAPGVFSGGDVAFGPKNLIDAVANGKNAAVSIDKYLTGRERSKTYEVTIESHYTPGYGMIRDYDVYERKTPDVAEPADRVGKQMIELSFDDDEAVRQASRCLTCHTSPVYNGDLCIICGRCVDICPQNCLSFVSLSEVEIEGIEDSKRWTGELGLDTSGDVSVLLKDDEKCIRCGLCASRCPTDALTMETIVVKEQPVITG